MLASWTGLDDPLPRGFLTEEPGIGGVIKQRPDDFLVDEIPLYEPCGEGEHLYLRVQKTRVSHGELIGRLRRHFRVREYSIGYAGMKDKQGVTQQTVSVHLPDSRDVPAEVDLGHERIAVLWADRHKNKLRRGHLRGNRFSIRVRDVDPIKVVQVKRQLMRMEQIGVPAYFGAQRFGYRRNNHLVGLMIVKGAWRDALRELIGEGVTPFPDYQRERRELFEAGQYREAAMQWTPADRNELTMIKALANGAGDEAAMRAVGRSSLSFWLNAWQSSIFNHVLDARLAAGELHVLHEGDVAWKYDSRSLFAVTAEELEGDVLADRLERFEISPSGPLWGQGMLLAEGEILARERAALEAGGITEEGLRASAHSPPGQRRPFRVPITQIETDAGVDEHGAFIRVAFDLPRGAYATIALRELMKSDDLPGDDRDD